jgi:hypothetical protein
MQIMQFPLVRAKRSYACARQGKASVSIVLLHTCVHSLQKVRQCSGRRLRRVMPKQHRQESLQMKGSS